jgi:DNA-binding NarL/FixJ family response regulator
MARNGQTVFSLVLIADDDEGLRTLLTEMLDLAGHSVVSADRGDTALALARRRRPDAVVLDVDMPGLSGYELCHRLREELGQDLPIVLLSGVRIESYDRVAGLLLGADDYIAKPFEPSELIARLRRLLDRVPRMPVSERLTPRELEVLTLLVDGLGQPEIADRLVISPKTVATHIQHILEKLGVHSRAQAVAAAHRFGLLSHASNGW